MFDSAALKELAARKRLLVLESELNRQAVEAELRHLRGSLTGMALAMKSGRILLRVLLLAAPVAGLVASRKQGRWGRLIRAALAGWRLWKQVETFRGGGQ
jgi:hypothetical protein